MPRPGGRKADTFTAWGGISIKVRIKVRGSMYKNQDDDLFQLFDTGEMEHVCDLVFNCHDPAPNGYRATLSESMEKFLLAPTEKFINRLYESGRGSNAVEFDASVGFRDCIENVMKLLSLSSEDGEMPAEVAQEMARDLRLAWLEFIAMSAAHRMYSDLPKQLEEAKKRSVRNRLAAGMLRKEVTKADLEKSKNEFIYHNGSKRGWIKAAEYEFGISGKTIKKRMRE